VCRPVIPVARLEASLQPAVLHGNYTVEPEKDS
jgi:hypothetical protein